MKETAQNAWHSEESAKENRNVSYETENEYVKVRVQSTPENIDGFHKLLDKCEELGLCQVMNFSDMFPNKGTNKYFRAYSDVRLNEGGVDNINQKIELKDFLDSVSIKGYKTLTEQGELICTYFITDIPPIDKRFLKKWQRSMESDMPLRKIRVLIRRRI